MGVLEGAAEGAGQFQGIPTCRRQVRPGSRGGQAPLELAGDPVPLQRAGELGGQRPQAERGLGYLEPRLLPGEPGPQILQGL